MSENSTNRTILVYAEPTQSDDADLESRRGGVTSWFSRAKKVDVNTLQGQVNQFIVNMSQMMNNTPPEVSGFQLKEFEVSAGLVFEGEGGVNIVWLADAKAKGGINAGMKFVFKRS